MQDALTIGAQAGGLPRAQAEHVADLVRRSGARYPVHLEIQHVRTEASPTLHDDHIAENRSALQALHERLRDGAIDVVIHRGFDLRGRLAEDLRVGAIPPRGSPYDALLGSRELTLDEMEPGHRVGVVQLRARAQLLRHRPDLELQLIEGDVGLWLTSLIDGEVDALVAPNDALEQLGLQERVSEMFPPDLMVPAPCSGVLVCVCRADDAATTRRLRKLHHAPTAGEYEAEVAFMRALGARWEDPIGTLAQRVRDEMAILGFVSSVDGARTVRKAIRARADQPEALGATLAELMLERGAEQVLRGDDGGESPLPFGGALAGDADWEEDDPPDIGGWTGP